jgi:regulator of cell morphogenesis and NO signaling
MQSENFYQITEKTKLADAVMVKPQLMQVFENFGIRMGLGEHTSETICTENQINLVVFLFVSNLYLTANVSGNFLFPGDGLATLIGYLQRSHADYIDEKYPAIKEQISKVKELNSDKSVKMVERFFDEYMQEVKEHFDYENQIVFPYILKLLQPDFLIGAEFSVDEYKNHHNDIEEKLNDLKSLLVRYLPVENDSRPRHRLLGLLFELEYDLHIHSLIEDSVLIPLVERLEKEKIQ